mgnify:CR=1 FL=1
MKKCGEFGGESAKGQPCQREAGWGRGETVTEGRCRHHYQEDEDDGAHDLDVIDMQEVGDRFSFPVPSSLPEQAKEIWMDLAKRLEEREVLNDLHKDAFLHLVIAHHMAIKTSSTLLQEGIIDEDQAHGGRPRKHPAWQQWRESVRIFKDLAERFGLTPKDQKALGIGEESEEETPMGKFLEEQGLM